MEHKHLTEVLNRYYANFTANVQILDDIHLAVKKDIADHEYLNSIEYKVQQRIDYVCNKYNVTIEDIRGNDRKHSLTIVRHSLCYILRKELGLSLSKVADIVGYSKQSHASIIWAVRSIQDRIDVYGFEP